MVRANSTSIGYGTDRLDSDPAFPSTGCREGSTNGASMARRIADLGRCPPTSGSQSAETESNETEIDGASQSISFARYRVLSYCVLKVAIRPAIPHGILMPRWS